MIRTINKTFCAVLFLVLCVCVCSQEKYGLKELGVQYCPEKYTPNEVYTYNVGSAEQGAVDPNYYYFYVVGLNLIHVINFTDPSNPSIVHHVEVNYTGEITDVETCGDMVAIAFDSVGSQRPLEGRVLIYDLYNPNDSETMKKINDLEVGAVPDMLYFTHDCQRLLVALEGELRTQPDGTVVDPEGGVAIIGNLKSESPSMRTLDFTQFNDDAETYMSQGVRWVYRGEGANIVTTFSQDLEPEYITINADDTVAYINLQDNNAVITLDLKTETITGLHALSRRDWSMECRLDASNRDDGINLQTWGIHGLAQPDAIKYLKHSNGGEYIITANEGSIKEYETPDYPFEWSEALRGQDFIEDDLVATSVTAELKEQLNDDAQLGRLEMSSVDGLNADGKYDEFLSYGTRSFSMYKIEENQLTQVYDSCDDFEVKISEQYPDIFNSNPKDDDETPYESKDSRSDDQGPSPESLALGDIDGEQLVFIGIERPGLVAVYKLNGEAAEFQNIHYYGQYTHARNKTFHQMYDDRVGHSHDPEDLRFIPAARSPTGAPLLVVCGSVSGTVAFLEVTGGTTEVTTTGPPEVTTVSAALQGAAPTHLVVLMALIVVLFRGNSVQ